MTIQMFFDDDSDDFLIISWGNIPHPAYFF